MIVHKGEHMFMLMNNKTPLTILKFLVEHDGEFHVRDISRKTDLSLGFVSRVLRELLKDELISVQKKGRMMLYCINEGNPVVKQIKILMTITKLYSYIKELRPLTRRIILFGSASHGENTPDSDIDLFIMSNDLQKVRTIISQNSQIAPIIMNSAEYANLKEVDFALYDQINRGIVLWEISE